MVGWVRTAGQPVPLEALADRAVRTLGHDRTVGTGWAGAGSFSNLLGKGLPAEIRLSDQPPYYVFDASRQLAQTQSTQTQGTQTQGTQTQPESRRTEPAFREPIMPRSEPNLREPVRQEPALAPAASNSSAPRAPRIDPRLDRLAATPPASAAPETAYAQTRAPQQYAASPAAAAPQRPAARQEPPSSNIQQSITRIHDACQAPPLAPPEYRALFEVMAQEINTNGLTGAQTLSNIAQRAAELGVEVKRDDVRFVLEVVSETDPWFEQGASANLFSSRFRNFVIARCRSQGMQLSAEELDLIDAWFGGSPMAQRAPLGATQGRSPEQTQAYAAAQQPGRQAAAPAAGDRWWSADEGRQYGASAQDDEMPLIVRNRIRG